MTNPKPDSEGNINLIEQAAQNGVKKFVLITSIGTGDSKDAPGEEVYNVLKPVLVEKAKAEQALMVSRFASCSPAPVPIDGQSLPALRWNPARRLSYPPTEVRTIADLASQGICVIVHAALHSGLVSRHQRIQRTL